MDKVRLTLEELQVQSFATTSGPADGRGTVRAHDWPTDERGCPTGNPAWDSCGDTCWETCGDSCGGSCNTCNCESADCSADTCFWGCYTDIGMISIC